MQLSHCRSMPDHWRSRDRRLARHAPAMDKRAAGGHATTGIDDHPGGPCRAAGDGGDAPALALAPVLTPHGALALRPSDGPSGEGVVLPPGLGAQLKAA